jgi:hypothetical protein
MAGSCSPGTQTVCPGADQCNFAGLCDPSSGACPPPTPKADGTLCNDNNICTMNDACMGGMCQGVPVCPAGMTCDPTMGTCS